ncbi:MAG: hypothetical protein K5696_07530 [Lachnospiraceae bacterium]|nr:hypothetical protein [Lachnospiraceae bacterium]
MAYKVSYKVVSEQGEQLKNIAKEMDNYISRLNQIVSKLGSDELLQSVRNDLNKFKQQLEEEKTVLNLAGQVITDVVQNYSGTEKKTVGKVDKAKAHNRDFYKRPVAVASAGGASAGAVASGGGAAAAYASSTVNVSAVSNNQTVVNNTTNVFQTVASPETAGMAASAAGSVAGAAASELSGKGAAMVGSIAAAVGSVAAAGGAIAGVELAEKRKAAKEESE